MKSGLVLMTLGAVLAASGGVGFGAEEKATEARASQVAKAAVPDVVLTEKDAGTTVTSEVGKTIEIRLRNEKAGAGWEPGGFEITGTSVVQATKTRRGNCDEFRPDKNAETNTTVGTYIYRYTCAAAGKSTIRALHLSPSGPMPLPRSATAFLGAFAVTIDVRDKAPAR